MPTYHVDEFSFEVPDGYRDDTLNLFVPEQKNNGGFSLTVARQPRTDADVDEEMNTLFDALAGMSKDVRVLARRATTVATVPAVEARVQARETAIRTYQRVLGLGHYEHLLVFTITSERAHHKRCDAVADALFASLKLREVTA
ncbi:MAG: DcrB-related protein [Polyangiaceae bacterium]